MFIRESRATFNTFAARQKQNYNTIRLRPSTMHKQNIIIIIIRQFYQDILCARHMDENVVKHSVFEDKRNSAQGQ